MRREEFSHSISPNAAVSKYLEIDKKQYFNSLTADDGLIWWISGQKFWGYFFLLMAALNHPAWSQKTFMLTCFSGVSVGQVDRWVGGQVPFRPILK